MDISGQFVSSCTPQQLIDAFNDIEVLALVLPAGATLERAEDGSFAFAIQRNFGPIALNLPGTLTVAPRSEGKGVVLKAHAQHMIGGKVDVDLDIRIGPHNGATQAKYTGEVAASGLAGRVLTQNVNKLQGVVRAGLVRLKLQAEAKYNPAGRKTAAPKA